MMTFRGDDCVDTRDDVSFGSLSRRSVTGVDC